MAIDATAPAPPDRDRLHVVLDRMAEAASVWLGSLRPAQRRKACYAFPAPEERTRWHYVPTERGGLPLVEMDPDQQRLAHRLIASGLSPRGYVAASTIMGLENVLDAVEGWQLPYPGRAAPNRGRDPLLYFISVFGDPSSGSWGWRVSGHHLALNYTIIERRNLAASPMFLGARPAISPLVGPGVLRPLAGEEDLARDLLQSLAPGQRARAVLSPVPPNDIVQSNRQVVETYALPRPRAQLVAVPLSEPEIQGMMAQDASDHAQLGTSDDSLAAIRYERTPRGLAAADMTPQQRALLLALTHQYLDRLPDEVAALEAPRNSGPALDEIHFAWAGALARGQPHYYRLQGPRLLIEYNNTQNGANHIHSAWRDPVGDFGADLMTQHVAN
jgi:hypothetical protein